jgi:membrane protein YdbS with pleckstrin-like domain
MRHSYRIFRTWIWELFSIILALGLIIAIAALLATYDGKPAPSWGLRFNFNALLALLSTIHRAMVVVIASQVISQRKWEWYNPYVRTACETYTDFVNVKVRRRETPPSF